MVINVCGQNTREKRLFDYTPHGVLWCVLSLYRVFARVLCFPPKTQIVNTYQHAVGADNNNSISLKYSRYRKHFVYMHVFKTAVKHQNFLVLVFL